MLTSTEQMHRVLDIFNNSDAKIRPHFILTGESGSGKSHTIHALCELLNMPMLEINAAQLTREGTAGNSLSKALSPLMRMGGNPAVVFVDEFDKLFISGNSNSELAHETFNGVQNEFLTVLESATTSVFHEFGKYASVPVDNCLFVFAGAFNGEKNIGLDRLREMGVKTEFLGRVALTFSLNKPTLEDLKAVLLESELLDDYLRLFKDVEPATATTAILEAIEAGYDQNVLGVRMINNLIHQFFINGSLTKAEAKKVSFQRTMSLFSDKS